MPKRTPRELFDVKTTFLTKAEKTLGKKITSAQTDLLDTLIAEYLPRFTLTSEGKIANTTANMRLLSTIDNYFDKLRKGLTRDVLRTIGSSVIEGSEMSAAYYVGLGFKTKAVDGILRTQVRIGDRIGITPTGKLRKEGYLYRLGATDGARNTLKNYVLKSITGDVPFLDFQLGFRNLVKGNRRTKGVATKGVLERYFDQYAGDVFNETDAIVNEQFARELELKHFIYEGSLIESSRRFCEKRAGKVFKVSDTRGWKNDPDLIDKKTKESYRPLVERGRYRCRHWIRYITPETYKALKGD